MVDFLFKNLFFVEGDLKVKFNAVGVIERKFCFVQLMLEVEPLGVESSDEGEGFGNNLLNQLLPTLRRLLGATFVSTGVQSIVIDSRGVLS